MKKDLFNLEPAYVTGEIPPGTRVQRVPTIRETMAHFARGGSALFLPTPVEVWDGEKYISEDEWKSLVRGR